MSAWMIGSGAYVAVVAFGLAMCKVASPAHRDDPETAVCRTGRGVTDALADAPRPDSLVGSSPAGNDRRQSKPVPAVAQSR